MNLEGIWARIDKNGPVPQHRPELGPCWIWSGGKTEQGYPIWRFSRKERPVRPYRVLYKLMVGPIQEGTEPDHLCRVRACCNPKHIEPVTHRVNCRRGLATVVPGARQRAKTHCQRGHAYDESNTRRYTRNGVTRRLCRKCQALNQRMWLAKQTKK